MGDNDDDSYNCIHTYMHTYNLLQRGVTDKKHTHMTNVL